MASTAAGKQRIPKVAKVKNKAPADLQITAEQLLREAKERELELLPPPPRQKISDEEELADYKLRKRKTFEDNIRKNRTVVTNWIKYAQWEESLKEIQRARSLYERALDVDHRNVTLWLKYAEMEMKNRQVNHARNIWDRAVTILPRINAFWYKYTYMEEMLSNVAGCRQVFERWMEWEPEEQAWHSYINFELRYKEVDAARAVYEKFVMVHPEIKNWIKYARFEDRHGYTAHARRVYERAVEFYGEEHMKEPLFVAFARFEEAQKEFDRVRVIYKYALDRIPKQSSQELFKNYTMFEKKYGDRRGIEDVIVSKRRFQYEEEVKANPHNYDAWFDYLRLVESDCEAESVREVYERAIANVPLLPEKRHWRRYIYLWINFALFEELEMKVLLPIIERELFERYELFMASVRYHQSFNIAMENLKQIVGTNKMDPDRTRQVYQGCLELIPHKKFTFSKIWLLFAQFEIRQKNLTAARKVLGMSIGKCPKNKLFKGYIELELQLREFDRCRKLYEKFLEFAPENCTTWMKFAELETILGDVERSRAIYELAVGQPRLDMPEVLWKSYIDFEIEQEECSRTRNLYRRLLQRTQHVKVWISFAKFELSVEGKERVSRCRRVYEEGNRSLRSCEEKEERVMLLEAWRDFEDPFGNEDSRERVQKLMPSRVKKRRKVQTDDGSDAGWEEYYDYIFPEDSANQPNLKLLSMAKMWKQQQYMEAHGIASTAQGAPQWVDEPMEEDEQRESDAQTSAQRQPGNEKGTVTARDKSDDDDGGDGREERGEGVATGDGDSGSVNEGEGESSGETSKKTPIEMEVGGGGGDDELVSTKAIKKEQENIGDRDPDKDRDETEDS